MNVFQLLFAVSIGLLGSACYEIYLKITKTEGNGGPQPLSLLVIAFVFLLGSFLLLASVPGVFLDEPHWFVDTLFSIIETLVL